MIRSSASQVHTTVSLLTKMQMLGLLLPVLFLSGCNWMFYQPDQYFYFDPAQFDLWHEEVTFDSLDGTQLSGWFLPAKGKQARGTVVLFHGNGANISNHVAGIRWLPHQGFSVFLFDYRGYGISKGQPSRRGLVEDGAAAINYVRGRKDVDKTKLLIYGQSLGGALAFNSLALAGTEGVRALVVEGAFASYKEVVRLIMSNTWFLWTFQYPVAYLGFSDGDHPLEVMDQLSQVPLLVIHGEMDNTVPLEAGKQLFEAFPGTDKEFWPIPHAAHQDIFSARGSPWRGKLMQYFQAKLPPVPLAPRAYNPPEPHVKW